MGLANDGAVGSMRVLGGQSDVGARERQALREAIAALQVKLAEQVEPAPESTDGTGTAIGG